MANKKKPTAKRAKPPVIAKQRSVPWLAIGAVAVVLALAALIAVVVLGKSADNRALNAFVPSASNQDPSKEIDDIHIDMDTYQSKLHVQSNQRVAYERFPPIGGPHDGLWAACNGIVYPVAMRDENMVHTLEHGAVWIAYNPDTTSSGDVETLEGLVRGQQFITMSPYPTLTDHPISLQAWGHQLQVDSADDTRVKEFITSLRRNQYVYPETGATCDQPSFPTTNIPPDLQFDPSPRGADAVPLDGGELVPATDEDHSQPTVPASQSGGSGEAGSGEPDGVAPGGTEPAGG